MQRSGEPASIKEKTWGAIPGLRSDAPQRRPPRTPGRRQSV